MSKLFKLLVLALVAMMVFSFIVSGCSGNKPKDPDNSNEVSKVDENKPQESSKEDKKEIKLRFATMDNPAQKLEVEEFAKGFKSENPNITIVHEPLTGDYGQKLLVQASSGTLPDVFLSIDQLVGSFAKKNVTLKLDEWMDKLAVDKNDFYPAMLKLGQFGGAQHMIPREYSHVVTYYNKNLFDEAKVPYPQNGWTWDEFKETARKLVKKEGNNITQYGAFVHMNWQASIIPMVIGLGGSIINDAGNEAALNTPGTTSALKEIKQLADEGVLVNNFVNGMPDFFSKKVGMVFWVRPINSMMEQQIGTGNWNVATFPKMPAKHVVGSGCSGYSVAATTQYPEEAVKLLFYTVSEKGQEVFMKTGNSVPVRKSIAANEMWKSIPSKEHNHDAYILYPEADILPLDNSLQDSSLAPKVQDVWIKTFEKVFLGEGSIEDNLKVGHENLNKIFKK